MKAVGYIRVSTETQVREGQGLKIQKKQIENYCMTHKLELAGIYEDRGISGASADEENLTIDREGLQLMLANIKSIRPDYLVVLNTSRLWRSDLVKVLIQRELKKHKVDVKAIDQPTYSIYSQDDPSQFLINGMMELLDQYQRLEIALKLKRGKLNKAGSGGFAGGQRALGYRHIILDNKSDIAIDHEEAKTVSLIKSLKNRGLSLRLIADYCNANRIPTKRGGKWHASTIKYILNNRLYEGVLEYDCVKINRPELAIE